MNNETILRKAIEKAVKNGYEMPTDFWTLFDKWLPDTFREKLWYAIIFSHDFAKAFLGEEKVELGDFMEVKPELGKVYLKTPTWQFHLQKMVLEKEPLKYIEKFI